MQPNIIINNTTPMDFPPHPSDSLSNLNNLDWLNIGKSFIVQKVEPIIQRKKHPNVLGEDLIEQSKKFFNVEKRKGAADFLDDQFSCDSEIFEEKKPKVEKMKKVMIFLFFLKMFFCRKSKKRKNPEKIKKITKKMAKTDNWPF